MEVKLYATLRLRTGKARIDLNVGAGDTVRDAIIELLERLPVLAPYVMTDDGELVDHVHIFLNGRNVRLFGGLDALIQEGQKLDIFPPIGGGRHSIPPDHATICLASTPRSIRREAATNQERAMDINERLEDGILIVHINDQINSTTAPILGEKLDTEIAAGHIHLVLDLSDAPYISSAGLRVLSIALKAVRGSQANGDLYLACLSKTVAYASRISGFDQVFCIYDTVAEAIAAMNASREMDWVD